MQIPTSTRATTRPGFLRRAAWSRGGRRAAAVVSVGALLSVAAGGVAQADDLYNTLAGSATTVAINDKVEVMDFVQGDAARSTGLRVQARNSGIDGFEGCNTQRGATVTFAFDSSDDAVAVVETPTLTFSACTVPNGAVHEQLLRIRPGKAGSATITARVQTPPATPAGVQPGSYRLDTAAVKVVVAPPPNSKPTVAVVGVTEGAEYRKGKDVATPMCESTDAEDGATTFAPAMSRGEDADEPNGLGLRIATCRYTDLRGDAAEPAVVRYFIVDGTPPVVLHKLERAVPANGWYRSEVALDWIVNDPESEATVNDDACDRVWINTDQVDAVYTCIATSKGGSTEASSPKINFDATAPVVTPTVKTKPTDVGGKDWYPHLPEITWEAHDATSGVAPGSLRETVPFASTQGRNMMVRYVATDNAGNTGGTSVQYVNVDASAPVVKASLTGTPDHTEDGIAWYKDEAVVEVTASDPEVQPYERGSGLAVDPTGAHVVTGTTDFVATATDNVGHTGTSATVPVAVDSQAPAVAVTCPKSPVIKGLPAKASWTATDEADGSGLAGPATGSVRLDTSAIGRHTASAPAAKDNVGHTGEAAECEYRVVYAFLGFLQPIDNFGVYNKVKAGSAVPVKFSLAGNQGMSILSGAPVATKVACPSGMRTDSVEDTVKAGSPSGLKYDAKTTVYTYTWKTATSFAGTCQKLTVNLADGTSQTALFNFTK